MMENDKNITFFNDQIKKLQDNIKQIQHQITTNLAVIKAFKHEVARLNKIKK